MNKGLRHSQQRSNRVALKADCVVLLDRLAAAHSGKLTEREKAQIAEMRMRLAPATGVAAPLILTRFTKEPR